MKDILLIPTYFVPLQLSTKHNAQGTGEYVLFFKFALVWILLHVNQIIDRLYCA